MSEIINTNNRYKLYLYKNYELIETIVVKLDDIAQAMNYDVMIKEGINSINQNDKTSWKYYQNIAGMYHLTDKPMSVSSLDVDGDIDFTTSALQVNKATKDAYSYGSRYYKELVSLYPDQELLILGILYPVNINTAINAKDGTILTYPKHLIEDNEYDLKDKLQQWIYNYLDRWVNSQYSISDDLYVATYVAQLYLHMLQALLCFRLQACKTNQVHSYHIQQYLASHGYLDKYLNTLTRSQALFFYRNIRYIERNPGKRDTFDWVTENAMTVRSLPLYEFIVNHDLKQLSNGLPTPDITVKRSPVNEPATQTLLLNYDLPTTLNVIKDVSKNNIEYHTDNTIEIKDDLTYSESSVLATKSLQSVVEDKTDAIAYPLQNTLLNHWVGLVATDTFKANVYITLPKDSTDVKLSSQQALALHSYLLLDSATPITTSILNDPITSFKSNKVMKRNLVTYNDIRSITDKKYLSDFDIYKVLETQVPIDTIFSIQAFRQLCIDINKAEQIQYNLYCSKEHQHSRCQMQIAIDRLYSDQVLTLDQLKINGIQMTYGQLLESLNLDLSNYDKEEKLKLASLIYTNITQTKAGDDNSLAAIQKAMSALLLQLSSYSIQLVNDINNSPIVIATRVSVRVGDDLQKQKIKEYIFSAPVKLSHTYFKSKITYSVKSKDLLALGEYKSKSKINVNVKIGINITKPRALNKSIYTVSNSLVGIYNNVNIQNNFNQLNITQKKAVYKAQNAMYAR